MFKTFMNEFENQFSKKIKSSDRGTKYDSGLINIINNMELYMK